MKNLLFLLLLMLALLPSKGQSHAPISDTLEDVLVTAGRTPQHVKKTTVPFQMISRDLIQKSGSQRISNILQEQAGLFVTSGFGAGVQMQGLNPEYTLILLNGEPLVGRTAGVLDLNRISTADVRKIEIIKGPASSLYGSEAIAGVINIITEKPRSNETTTGLRYGFGNPDQGWSLPFGSQAFKAMDFQFGWSRCGKKTDFRHSVNAFYQDGISYRPFSSLRVPQPVWRLSQQATLEHRWNAKTSAYVSARQAYDHVRQEFSVNNNGFTSQSYGREANTEWNVQARIRRQVNPRLSTQFNTYGTLYRGSQRLRFTDKPDSLYNDQFRQQLYRLENQTEYQLKQMRLVAGGGIVADLARSTRYDDVASQKRNSIYYLFTQQEWSPTARWTLAGGVRYDYNTLFTGAFSPKFSARYQAGKRWAFTLSAGQGFKAPDFRQLYLNFTNTAAGGYSVLGSIDAVRIVNALNQQGVLSEIRPEFGRLNTLTPEFSTGYHAGVSYTFPGGSTIQLQGFRNDIRGLIDVVQVATRTDGSQIFSYLNLNEAYTQGLEAQSNIRVSKRYRVNAGYQLLYTGNQEDLRRIRAGSVYTRNEDGSSRVMKTNEYRGLPNRSRHMAHLKLLWEDDRQRFAHLRFVYRSGWYVADRDGNGLYNVGDEKAPGFLLVHVTAGIQRKSVRYYFGIDNLLNYQNTSYLPNQQGRSIYLGIHLKFHTT